jgi:hypothetical protein
MTTKGRKKTKLVDKQQLLASKFIAEEFHTNKYPPKQAIAIGLSRTRAALKKVSIASRLNQILKRYG